MSKELIGKWAFILGLVIAVIAGLWTMYVTEMLLVLFVLGLIVGFLNIAEKTSDRFLIAVIALLMLGIGSISVLSTLLGTVNVYLTSILGNFIAFVGAAGLVVAVKTVVQATKR